MKRKTLFILIGLAIATIAASYFVTTLVTPLDTEPVLYDTAYPGVLWIDSTLDVKYARGIIVTERNKNSILSRKHYILPFGDSLYRPIDSVRIWDTRKQ